MSELKPDYNHFNKASSLIQQWTLTTVTAHVHCNIPVFWIEYKMLVTI